MSKAAIFEYVLTKESISNITAWAEKGNRWRRAKFYDWEYECEGAGAIERAIDNQFHYEVIRLTKAGVTIAKLNKVNNHEKV